MDEVERQTKFIDWLHDKLLEEKKKDTELWRYVKGPTGAKEYSSYRVNGFVFSPFSQESSRATRDSGVCIEAVTTYRRKKGDKSHVSQMTKWYGIIKQILEVDYTNRKIVEFVFYCDWVKVESVCKMCPDSNLVVVHLDKIRSV
ncbi:uncharacterized protein LOC113335347 [Papaver somniferum]|uniref:uncharacterized protein LOC113335347 n=1 Tax=Papaver somniferum TaxID=3469 RepID=UPI000E6F6E80|nr:uncharacterized protein LOC113335347 [Papaver somniferum]